MSFTAYSVPDVIDLAVPLEPRFPLKVRLGDDAQTLGYDLEGPELANDHPTIQAGETLSITLYWRSSRPANKKDEYRIFVHLVD